MSATQRLESKHQTLEDAYSPPANFLEIDVCSPELHGEGKNRYVDYEVKLRVSCLFIILVSQTNLPVFRLKESSVRRRYSDFEWLRTELDRESKPASTSSTESYPTCSSSLPLDFFISPLSPEDPILHSVIFALNGDSLVEFGQTRPV
ncbi:unnamed protein product [Dibothriocephalus latus]|uniref:Sorting nexin-3 n=1 Tax=Dibothriocephalus latus TaxID=60516 RepID=A0A3P6SVK0_DIBLA|nr:unnamed protein product [Dibothriocephalus latus]